MKLSELLRDCNSVNSDVDITDVEYDSRKVKEGYLFVAITGKKNDGHDFIADAIKKGAVAIVHEKATSNGQLAAGSKEVSFIKVENSRKALACIAHNFYGRPSDSLILIGITGTNGKTTTTYILKSILESWGKVAGLIGTIQYMIKDRVYPAQFTTPESLEFHGLLRNMLLSGCTHVITEVSSHALAQYRVDSALFKIAIFTNLTRDHLDYHKTMENYFRAKERLFIELLDHGGTAVINHDDQYGRRLLSLITPHHPYVATYGLKPGSDMVATDIDNSIRGLRFKILSRGRSYEISSHLMGLPNVYNIMSAAAASLSIGVPWEIICEGIEKVANIAGRFEKVDLGQGFVCIIDYAHTEDALENLICSARELVAKSSVISHQISGTHASRITPHTSRRIITVFGCGGDRDRGKRPGMGAVATRFSDFVIITSDNPRSEEPSEIITEIVNGAVRKNYLIEIDRREAIRRAIEMADENDIILIAGKGHEDYQEIKGVRYKFNDKEIIEEAIKHKMQDTRCRMQD